MLPRGWTSNGCVRDAPDEVIACIQERWEVDGKVASKCYSYLCPVFVAELEPHHLQPVTAAAAKELGKDSSEPEALMEPRLLKEVSG
jgi:hypothetical protein